MNRDDSAFPQTFGIDGAKQTVGGLSKREYISAHVLASMTSSREPRYLDAEDAQIAVKLADLLLAELGKK